MGLLDFEPQKSKPVVVDAQHTPAEESNSRWFKRIFVFGLSLLGAAILWFLSALNHNYTSYIKYPIRIIYDANQYVPVSKLPTYVTLNATGYGWDFLRKTLSVKKKPVLLKPNNLPRRKFYTDSELLIAFSHQLNTVKVNFFETDTIFFEFDMLASKKMYFKIDTSNCRILEPQEKAVYYFKTNPQYINISGAKKLIEQTKDTINLVLNDKELELGFNEVLEIDHLIHPSLKSDATEVEIILNQK